jgi:mono/diheme cytochrome c family protein
MKLTLNLFALLFFVFAAKAQSVDKAILENGKAVYEQHCLVCHQADGSGVQNLNPPLIKTKWVLGDKSTLIGIILKGLDEEIEVDGEIYHNVMPGLDYISDKEIADVLTYVRNSFTNKASPVSEAEVEKHRAAVK